MLDSHNVIANVTSGMVKELAQKRDVSPRRMYEILGPDNPYPKAKELIRDIAEINQEGARLIKADIDALFDDVLTEDADPTLEELHKEAYEAIQALLADKPRHVKEMELRELIAIACSMLSKVQNGLTVVKAEAA